MKKLIASTLLLLLLAGCETQPTKFRAEYFDYFDTFIEVTFYCEDENTSQAIMDKVDGVLKEYHQLFDPYQSYAQVTNLKTINDAANKQFTLDPILADTIRFCLDNYDRSGGKVNIAAGSVLRLWHDYMVQGVSLPPMIDLQKAGQNINIGNISLNGNELSIQNSNTKLEFGAIAKGIAAEAVVAAMKEEGVVSGIVNMGGNVVCFGKPPERDYYVAAIQNPKGEGIVAKVAVTDGSLVTSGDYQRFYMVNGQKYHHIIDLHTLMPGGNFSSVTVYHESSAIADLLSTTLFLSSFSKGSAIAQDYGAEVLWIYPDGRMESTSGFPLIQ